jgi:hypothetical protein
VAFDEDGVNARRYTIYSAQGRDWRREGEAFTAIPATMEAARKSDCLCAKAEAKGRRFAIRKQTSWETWTP